MMSNETVSFRKIRLSCHWKEPLKPSFHKLDFEALLRLGQQHSGLTVSVYPDAADQQYQEDVDTGRKKGLLVTKLEASSDR